jgi:hypothetical protein
VFGPDGQVPLALSLHGFSDRWWANQRAEYTDTSLRAAATVTRTAGGLAPS